MGRGYRGAWGGGRCKNRRVSDPASILIIRPSALGDVCRSVPVLVSLRARFPRARIGWLVQDSFAEAVRWHPLLDEVVAFPRRALGEAMRGGHVGEVAGYLRSLAARRYELVVDVQGLFRSGALAWATRARRRVGYRDARELGWLGYTERHSVGAELHAVDRMLGLVEAMGVRAVRDMRLSSGEEERAWAGNDLRRRDGRYVVIAPTSRWAGKRWGIERFAEVARWVLSRGLCAAVVGGKGEREQCGALVEMAREDTRVMDLVGETTVGQLMALIERSAGVVANDSAALHMAVGFDRALIGLFGPTNVSLVGPYGRERDVIQEMHPGERNRHKNEAWGRAAMEAISSRRVLEAALERLAEPGGSFKR